MFHSFVFFSTNFYDDWNQIVAILINVMQYGYNGFLVSPTVVVHTVHIICTCLYHIPLFEASEKCMLSMFFALTITAFILSHDHILSITKQQLQIARNATVCTKVSLYWECECVFLQLNLWNCVTYIITTILFTVARVIDQAISAK